MLKGVGVGLRSCHYSYIENEQPDIPWFEVLSDNYLCEGGTSLNHLEKIRSSYPVTLHGVGMSLGSTDPLNLDYLAKLKKLISITKPQLVSDHLCWTSFNAEYFHELLPLPYTEEAIIHVAKRIQQVQDYLNQQIMIENVSSYLQFTHSTLKEWEFLQAIADEADCLILLDINNVYVSAYNNDFDPNEYLHHIPANRIAQFHLAGFSNHETYLLDTHGASIHPPVWKLFEDALKKFGPIPTIIEWDNDIPEFHRLYQEAKQAQKIMDRYEQSMSCQPLLKTCRGKLQQASNKICWMPASTGMTSTTELQQQFVKSLHSKSNEILHLVKNQKLSSQEHINIYRNSMIGAFQKVLKEIYPVCNKLVGEEFFIGMINVYIEQTHSISPDLGHYGKNFSDFIATFPPAKELPYLSDVAKLEWAWHCICSSPDNPKFDFQKLQECFNQYGDQIQFTLPAGSFLIKSIYPIHRIWEVNQENYSGDQTIVLENGINYYYLVWRTGLEMRMDELRANEWQLLTLMSGNLSIEEISNKICSDLPSVDLVKLLPHLVSKGWLAGFKQKMIMTS